MEKTAAAIERGLYNSNTVNARVGKRHRCAGRIIYSKRRTDR
jgi:hypothetical protein